MTFYPTNETNRLTLDAADPASKWPADALAILGRWPADFPESAGLRSGLGEDVPRESF